MAISSGFAGKETREPSCPATLPKGPGSLPREARRAATQEGFAVLVFFIGQPPSGRPAMALPIVEVQTLCPNSSSKAWRCSSRVRSSLASRCLGSHSLSITPFLEGLPGIGSGSTSPVSRRLLSQRFMEGIETEKVFATCSLGLPESTAESTLNLRSFEYGFMPEGYHIWIDTYGCRCNRCWTEAMRNFQEWSLDELRRIHLLGTWVNTLS